MQWRTRAWILSRTPIGTFRRIARVDLHLPKWLSKEADSLIRGVGCIEPLLLFLTVLYSFSSTNPGTDSASTRFCSIRGYSSTILILHEGTQSCITIWNRNVDYLHSRWLLYGQFLFQFTARFHLLRFLGVQPTSTLHYHTTRMFSVKSNHKAYVPYRQRPQTQFRKWNMKYSYRKVSLHTTL